MANDWTHANVYIPKAVSEATRVAIQTMFMASTVRTENVGSRKNGPIMKQPIFDCISKNKYAELRNFKLMVKSMLQNFMLCKVVFGLYYFFTL